MFEVTRKIEDATANIPGARHVTSTISDGFSETFIEFEINKDVQEALDDVRDAVTGVRSALPADVLEPTISRVTTNGSSIATYAISADNMDTADLSWFVDNILTKATMPIDRKSVVSGKSVSVSVNLGGRRFINNTHSNIQ